MSVLIRKARTLKKYLQGYTSFQSETIVAIWGKNDVINTNWGDALNPYIIKHLSGTYPIYYKDLVNVYHKPVYTVIGSYLGLIKNGKYKIWGTGFINHKDKFQCDDVEIFAVRGPLTAEKIRKQGMDCPDVYGDPALLYPMFYYPQYKPIYKLGIIAHIRENSHSWLDTFNNDHEVTIIDISGGIKNVVDQINSCENIASSALHGLICADSYGIPTVRLKITDTPLGDGFKYLDYLSSVGRESEVPLQIDDNVKKEDILNFIDKNYKQPNLNIDRLYNCCPFLNRDNNFSQRLNRIFKKNI